LFWQLQNIAVLMGPRYKLVNRKSISANLLTGWQHYWMIWLNTLFI